MNFVKYFQDEEKHNRSISICITSQFRMRVEGVKSLIMRELLQINIGKGLYMDGIKESQEYKKEYQELKKYYREYYRKEEK